MNEVLQFGSPADKAERLRKEWGNSLAEHMEAKPGGAMSRKELVERLKVVGCDVSVQAVGQWVRGETSPRPHHQAALAAVLEVPVRRLFPIEAVSA